MKNTIDEENEQLEALQERLFFESMQEEEYQRSLNAFSIKKELHQVDLEEYIDELNKNTPDPLPENFKPF